MLTTPWDQPSLATACITWYLSNDCTCPSTFISPQLWAQKNGSVLIITLMTYMNNCAKHWRKHKYHPHLRLKGRGNTMITRPMPFHWNQVVTRSCQKPMSTKGGERWKNSGRRNHVPDCKRHPFIPHEEPVYWTLMSPPLESTSSDHPHNGSSFMYRCKSSADKVHHHHPGGIYSESEWEW